MKHLILPILFLLPACSIIPDKPPQVFEQVMLDTAADHGCMLKSLEVNRVKEKLRIVCIEVPMEDDLEFE